MSSQYVEHATIVGRRFLLCGSSYCFPHCLLCDEKRESEVVIRELEGKKRWEEYLAKTSSGSRYTIVVYDGAANV